MVLRRASFLANAISVLSGIFLPSVGGAAANAASPSSGNALRPRPAAPARRSRPLRLIRPASPSISKSGSLILSSCPLARQDRRAPASLRFLPGPCNPGSGYRPAAVNGDVHVVMTQEALARAGQLAGLADGGWEHVRGTL